MPVIRPFFDHTKIGKTLTALAVGTALVFAGISVVVAQKSQDRVSPQEEKQASETELEVLQQNIVSAGERQQHLRDEIGGLDKDLESINRALIETAKRSHNLEQKIADEEVRLEELAGTRTNIRGSLLSKRALLAEVLAALQRMGRNPPPAILVRPEDALQSVRSAILLGAVVPEIRSETDTLFAELRALGEVTRQIGLKKAGLADDLNDLAEDETRLTLLVEEKNSIAQRSRFELMAEQKKAEVLAGQARSLEELIGNIETQIASAARAAREAKEADTRRRSQEQQRLASAREAIKNGRVPKQLDAGELGVRLDPKFSNNSRTEPAVAFTLAHGLLPRPASGKQIYAFGATNASGAKYPNIAIATRPNSRVRTPADGWVVYAGPFRSYGQLVILNVGEEHHVVLFGMADVNVRAGQFVLTGEPIARMGITRVATTSVVDLSSAQPVLYIEFRKDGKSIDPSPWWAATDKKRLTNDS